MAIEELKKEERKMRVPTGENPVFMRLKVGEKVVMFTGKYTGTVVKHDPADHHPCGYSHDGWVDHGDTHMWDPVHATFTPCEPEYEEPVLKLPFARKREKGSIIVYCAMEGGLFKGYYVGGDADIFFHSKEFILATSVPVRITGPTRKPAEIQYPALYRWKDGGEAVYTRHGHGFVLRGDDLGVFVDDTHLSNATRVTDSKEFPQPNIGEWELPFAVNGLKTWIAYAKDGSYFKCVESNTGTLERFEIFTDGTLNGQWKPTTIG
jgi:hypothetical protein